MCLEVFLVVDVLTHDPLVEIYDPPWGRGLFFPTSEDRNSSVSRNYVFYIWLEGSAEIEIRAGLIRYQFLKT